MKLRGFSYFSIMNTLHRIVGGANLFFLVLMVMAAGLPWAAILAGPVLMALVIILIVGCLVAVAWGARNAIHYWGGPPKVTVVDHVLLAAGVLNGLILVTAIARFIYIGEN